MTRFTYLFVLLAACTVEKNLLTAGEDATDTGGTLGASSDGPLASTGDATTSASHVTIDETTGAPLSTTDEATGAPLSTTDEATGGGTLIGTEADPSGDDNTGGAVDGAAIERTCAPNDGAALEFRLRRADNTCEAGPGEMDLIAVIYQAAPLAPGSYELGNGLGHWEAREDGVVIQTGNTGTIIINAWDDDLVSGHFELTDQGGAFPGFFELAPFCGGTPSCG